MFDKHLRGVHVPHHKDTAAAATVPMPTPSRVTIGMLQHMGAECVPLVKVNDLVKVGQKIGDSDAFFSVPIHASIAGKVKAIDELIMPAGNRTKAVVIEADAAQETDPDLGPPKIAAFSDFIARVRESGLVGLGGAGFPTHIKLNPKNLAEVDTLIVNGAECEPYITSDVRAMLEEGENLISGMRLIMRQLDLKKGIIGVEDNKPEAIAYLKQLCDENMEVRALKALYPQGGEKVLIYETTGKVVQEGKLPADFGVIVMNVSSVIFLDQYFKTGMPLIKKRLTVAGGAIAEPKNVWAPIGTSFGDVVAFCGGYKKDPAKIIMGGPMMGLAVYNEAFPVLKNNNAVLAFTKEEIKSEKETACIRCDKCIGACPFSLMPANIDRALQAGDIEELKRLKVQICMECGCCAYVCPARRHLVLSNRLAKKAVRESEKRG